MSKLHIGSFSVEVEKREILSHYIFDVTRHPEEVYYNLFLGRWHLCLHRWLI